jgi:general secretion pathway protein A
MYTDWFKLKRLPFRLRPDPDFLYLAGETAHVFAALRAAVTGAPHGLVTLVAEAGIGKTTLLHAIAQECQRSMTVARLLLPTLAPSELFETLREQFHLDTPQGATTNRPAQLGRFFAEEAGHGRAVLILVDEAHRCAAATLRELVNLCTRAPAPALVLAGEQELLSQLTALATRGTAFTPLASLVLPRLDATAIRGYLAFRLNVAGANGRSIFARDAVPEILRYTGGTPQLINMLCDSAMMLAEAHSNPRVGAGDVRDAAQGLKWVEFTSRTPAQADVAAARTDNFVPALEVRHRGQHVARHVLKPGRLIVGRADDAGLRLDSQFISRQHFQIITTADQSFVEDLGSTNGIVVNGRRAKLHRLVHADTITIGEHQITYVESPAAPS